MAFTPASAAPGGAPAQAEVSVLSLRRHGRHLFFPVLALIAIAAATGFWVGGLPEAWMNWASGIAALALAALLGIGPILDWLVTRSTITSRRVIQRRGFLVHHRSEVSLALVRGVRSTRGPVQRMFGSGDVELLVGAEEPVVLHDVPGCAGVVDALQELIEQNFVLGLRGTGAHARPEPGGAGGQAGSTDRGEAGSTTVLPGL